MLCLLVIGAGTTWAEEVTAFDWSKMGNTNTITSGYTTTSSGASPKDGYYQDNTGTVSLTSYNKTTPMFTSTPSKVTIKVKLGGGSANKQLADAVYAQFVDKSGNVIGNSIEITSYITTAAGDVYTKEMNLTGITSAYGIKLTHIKESGYNVRYYNLSLNYTTSNGGSTPTALSAPTNLSSSNVTTTGATLSWDAVANASSYTVKIGEQEYTGVKTSSYSATSLTAGTQYTWTVKAVGDGTNYTTSDYAANANFTTATAPAASYKAYFNVNGTLLNEGGTSFTKGASITFPADPDDINDKKFVGWTQTQNYSNETDAPSDMTKSAKMGDGDVIYYAVFATASGSGNDEWVEITSAPVAGTYAICTNSYFMKAAVSSSRFSNGSATPSITDGKLTSAPAEDCTWEITKPDDYYRIQNGTNYAGGTNTKNQGALLTDESTDLAKWSISYETDHFEVINYGRSKASSDSNNKYLRNNSANGWATYVKTTGDAPRLFKKVVGTTYSDYCTTVTTKPTPTLSFANPTYNATLGEDFAAPKLNNPENVAVTYSANPEGVVNVIPTTGAVELVAAGTTTITASFGGNDDFKSNFASYELVVAPAPLPKYRLTITQPAEGGVLTVKNGETALATGDEVEVRTQLTCEVTEIPEGKRFSRFYAKWGEGEGESKYKMTNPATFDNIATENISACEIYVSYKDIQYYTINYMINGVNTNPQVDLEENSALVFPKAPATLGGKSFRGWVEEAINEPVADEPTFITINGLTAKDHKTYHAVYASKSGESDPNILTSVSSTITSGDYYLVDTYDGVDKDNNTAPRFWAVNGGLNGSNGTSGGFTSKDVSFYATEENGNLSLNLTGVASTDWPTLYTVTVTADGVSISKGTETYYCTVGANDVNADMKTTAENNIIWSRLAEGTDNYAGRYSIEVDYPSNTDKKRCLLFQEHTEKGNQNRQFKNQEIKNRDAGRNANNVASFSSGYFYFLQAGSASYSDFTTMPAVLINAQVTTGNEKAFNTTGETAVILNRNFNDGAYNTLVLPFDMTKAQIEDVFGGDAKVYDYKGTTAASENTVTLKFEAATTISANTPVFIYGATNAENKLIEGVTIEDADQPTITDGNGEFNFVGVYAISTVAVGDIYINSQNQLKTSANGTTKLQPTRAYFKKVGTAEVRAFSINDEETGIVVVENGNVNLYNGEVYNLAGQKVSAKNMKSGIYVIGGRKVVIK